MKIIEDGTVTNPKGYKGAGLHIGIKKKNKDFALADSIRDELSKYLSNQTGNKPMIISVLQEI